MTIDFTPDTTTSANNIDFQPDAQAQGVLAQGAQVVAPINIGGARFGGNLTEDIGTGLSKLGFNNAGQAVSNFGQNIINNAPSVYGQASPNATFPNFTANLMQGAPYAALTAGAGIIPNIIGAAAYGATQSAPGNALGGTALSAGLAALPLGFSALRSFYNAVSPEVKMNNLLQTLGQGQGLEQNSKSLASDINNAAETAENNSTAKYQPILNQVGNNQIYGSGAIARKGIPDITGQGALAKAKSQYLNLPSSDTNNFDSDTSGLHQAFYNKPTFDNAKNLSSQIGVNIGRLERMQAANNLDTEGQNQLNSYRSAYGAINNDMASYLEQNHPELATAYQNAKDDFITNVVPYRIDPSMSDIATGNIENPQNISSIFANPEAHTLKIAGDLPQSSLNKIIYDKLGTPSATRSPESFLNATNNLDKQGLTSYLSDNVQNQIEGIKSAIKNKEAIQGVAGMVGGAMLSPHFGEGSELIGGLVGQKVLPWLVRRSGLGAAADIGASIGQRAASANGAYSPLFYAGLAGLNNSRGAQ